MNTAAAELEHVAVADLIPYANNARTHTDDQITQIASVIKKFGWGAPLLIDKDNGVIAGHARLLAAKKLKRDTVPCVRLSHLTDAQRKAMILADNRIALNSGWDFEMLAVELDELHDLKVDLSMLGFERAELNDMIGTPHAPPPDLTDPDAVPDAPPVPISRKGDVWQLGGHRIMVGDCRNAKHVARLINGTPINVAFTSPPYAEQREYDRSSGFVPVPADHYVEWFAPVAANVAKALAPDGSWFVNMKPHAEGLDTSLYVFDLVLAHVRQWNWHFATELCWQRAGMPKGVTQRFKNQFEAIYQFALDRWKMRPQAVMHASDAVPLPRGAGAGNTSWAKHQGKESIYASGHQGEPKFEWFGDDIAPGMAYPGNLLPTFAGSHEALGHAAAFPVGLPEFFIRAYTDEHDAVFDPFLGSGSTIIAAERTNRVGFGMELSPTYCDVSVLRWQNLTGGKATHDRTGKKFNE